MKSKKMKKGKSGKSSTGSYLDNDEIYPSGDDYSKSDDDPSDGTYSDDSICSCIDSNGKGKGGKSGRSKGKGKGQVTGKYDSTVNHILHYLDTNFE
jgi:hypothetical protein